MQSIHTESIDRLYQAILLLETKEECGQFLEDLCTIMELQDMAQRLEVALLLKEGKSYQEISASTGVSAATISRVSRCLNYGSGGYIKALEKMEDKA